MIASAAGFQLCAHQPSAAQSMTEATAPSSSEHLLGSRHAYSDRGLDPDPPVRSIAGVKRRVRLRDIPRSLPVARVIAGRDLRAQYKQSFLGPLWLLVQPLGLVVAFGVVFGRVVRVDTGGVPYPLFVLVGLSVYSYFQAALTTGTNAVVVNMSLIRRVAAPRIAFPTASTASALPVLGVTFTVAFLLALGSGNLPFAHLVLLPICLAWLGLFTWSLVALLNSLTVRFRDVMYVLPFLLQMLLFLSPVAYRADQASPSLSAVLELNPLAGILELWRWTLLEGWRLDGTTVAIAVAWTAGLAVAAWRVFTRLEPTMADHV